MENIWDKYAEKDPRFYILTSDIDYSTVEGQEYFNETGVTFTRETIANVEHLLPGKKRALEIGCGIGRLTFPHAKVFDEIIAVDISATMLEKLELGADERRAKNIKTYLSEESWDSFIFDYAFSFIVFQHIEDFTIIENYIKKISSSLKWGG